MAIIAAKIKITDEINGGEICKREIWENIRRVRTNQPLTKPLKILNQFCEFKEEWEQQFNLVHEKELKAEEAMKRKIHLQLPEIKKEREKYLKKYYKRPEVKERKKEFMRKYSQRPEVKKRKKEYDSKRREKKNEEKQEETN